MVEGGLISGRRQAQEAEKAERETERRAENKPPHQQILRPHSNSTLLLRMTKKPGAGGSGRKQVQEAEKIIKNGSSRTGCLCRRSLEQVYCQGLAREA